MLYLGQNRSCLSPVSTNGVFERAKYKPENTGSGHNFWSTNAIVSSPLAGTRVYQSQYLFNEPFAIIVFFPEARVVPGNLII
jgi:hypothetical protein